MEDLTPRQKEILHLIREHTATSGFPPTRADICRAMGFKSPNAAEEHLRALERKGAIEILAGASRGIRITQESGVPLVGRVAAGSPILATGNIERHYNLDPRMFKPHADYLLSVKGESMRDAGILDGDLLAVHSTSDFRPGQIVVARIGDEVTVKRIQRQKNLIELLPENPAFKPILVNPKSEPFAVEGVAVGVIRNGLH
jgi:repressor LexA